jgi:hypothetical protein
MRKTACSLTPATAARFSPLSLLSESQTQAAAGKVAMIAIRIGCFFLILSGIGKGFRRQANQP